MTFSLVAKGVIKLYERMNLVVIDEKSIRLERRTRVGGGNLGLHKISLLPTSTPLSAPDSEYPPLRRRPPALAELNIALLLV